MIPWASFLFLASMAFWIALPIIVVRLQRVMKEFRPSFGIHNQCATLTVTTTNMLYLHTTDDNV